MPGPKYGRILLKLSGEVLAGKQEFGIDPLVASRLASEIKTIHELNVTIGLIIVPIDSPKITFFKSPFLLILKT